MTAWIPNTSLQSGQNCPQTIRKFRDLLGLLHIQSHSIPKFASFTENLGNGVILDMIAIPGGKFLMGSPENEEGRYHRESPQHEVTIQPFYMGKYPVTQAQWKKVASLPKVKTDLNPKPSFFKGENLPVEQVSWLDAQEFCTRLSQATGKLYRFSSESEWEYACRAKTTTRYYFGDNITDGLVNYNMRHGKTTEVGKFLPNAFGLYDMHGNVCEWCEDNLSDSYRSTPVDGSAWISRISQIKVLRGGSWGNSSASCRSAYRNTHHFLDHYSSTGFRVACTGAAEIQ